MIEFPLSREIVRIVPGHVGGSGWWETDVDRRIADAMLGSLLIGRSEARRSLFGEVGE